MMFIRRYERGNEVLDLERDSGYFIDENNEAIDEIMWTAVKFDKQFNIVKTYDFNSEINALLFVKLNGWVEQVL